MRLTAKIRWKRLSADAIIRQVEVLEMEVLASAKAMVAEIIERNVGTQYFTLPMLAKMGHPYSLKGNGRPGGLPKGVVNKQGGDFYESISVRGPLNTGKRISIYVKSTNSEKSDWLLTGTDRMQGRPWNSHLKKELRAVVGPYIKRQLQQRLKLTVKA